MKSLWSMDLSKLFSIGFNLGMCCFVQIALGFMLCWVYSNSINDSFQIMYSISDNEFGSVMRLSHSTMASMIYVLIVTHMAKVFIYNLVFESSILVWTSGILIFCVLVVLTFLGYVLPMTQMSFWGLTVFSNIIGTIPILGNVIVYWFWGGEFINEYTLLKVHVLHIVLPLVMLGMVILHLFLLHQYLSSDSIDRFAFYNERLMFMYWFYFRDLNIMLMIMLVLQYGIYIYWSFVFHEESFIIVNPQKTPEKVMPEWCCWKSTQERFWLVGVCGVDVIGLSLELGIGGKGCRRVPMGFDSLGFCWFLDMCIRS